MEIVNLYIIDINLGINHKKFLLENISDEQKEKYLSFAHEADQIRSLISSYVAAWCRQVDQREDREDPHRRGRGRSPVLHHRSASPPGAQPDEEARQRDRRGRAAEHTGRKLAIRRREGLREGQAEHNEHAQREVRDHRDRFPLR